MREQAGWWKGAEQLRLRQQELRDQYDPRGQKHLQIAGKKYNSTSAFSIVVQKVPNNLFSCCKYSWK